MHETRRRRVLEALGADGVLIVAALPELQVGLDTELRYHPDPDLYYLTGCMEPEAVLVMSSGNAEAPYSLFVRPRDPERELWSGARGGPEAARERYGADAAHPIGELAERIPELAASASRIFARIQCGRPDVDDVVLGLIRRARRARPRSGKGPLTLSDYALILDELRLRKDDREIAAIREAAGVTVEAFREALWRVRAGAGEWQVEAALEAEFRMRGASGPAFPTIVAAGANATVLHYIDNACTMQDGQLLLVDAGARKAMYCADITRTIPVGGKATSEQGVVLRGVLEARNAAIEAVRPGATIRDVHHAALRVLLAALIELGILEGPVERALEHEEEYKPYFPHRTSHWLGLDVHDVGDYVVAGEPRTLEPGMVLTIEPGLYIGQNVTSGPAALAGTGVRIEDDVWVTPGGREVLTAALPADPDLLVSNAD